MKSPEIDVKICDIDLNGGGDGDRDGDGDGFFSQGVDMDRSAHPLC